MRTQKKNITNALRKIDRELEEFTVGWRKQRCAAWLVGEMEPLMLKVLQIAGPQSQPIGAVDADNVQQAGGEGVSGGAVRSECDLSALPNEIPQSVPSGPTDLGEAKRLAEKLGYRLVPDTDKWIDGVQVTQATAGNDGIDITYEVAPELKEEAQCSCDNAAVGVAVQTVGLMVPVAENVAPKPAEPPRWPAETDVTVIGNVPNPSLMAVSLSDGRRVSLLKRFKQEYGRGRKYRVKLSTRGTLGNPIYEEAG